MTEAAILERQEQVVASEKLNSKATKEIEQLLEESERVQLRKDAGNGSWYFRMPAAGVKYYSF